MAGRPFRFGLSIGVGNEHDFLARVGSAERTGYSTVLVADHLGFGGPWATLAAAAAATDRIRLGTFVLNNDFWHPALVAREAATIDVLSSGRFELGMGAGHMASEYQQAGLEFDRAPVRIERLGEAVAIIRGLLAGEEVEFEGEHYRIRNHSLRPAPPQGDRLPLLIGGNGDLVLTLAARAADVVGFVGFSPRRGGSESAPTHFSIGGLVDRVALVAEQAGSRFDDLELNILVQWAIVTDDPLREAEGLARRWEGSGLVARALLDSPFIMIGSAGDIGEKLVELRESLGISYLTVFDGRSPGFDRVVEDLAGR